MRLPQSIATALEGGTIVIASSSRAARSLKRLDSEERRAQGLSAWRSAEIVDWDGWLHRLWQQRLRSGNESRLLLSTAQERRVWARLVKASLEGRRLLSIDGVADLAQEAYRLLAQYDAFGFLQGELFGGSDVESFRKWTNNFERACDEEGWLSSSLLPLALRDAARRERLALPRRLLLTGFDRISPTGQALLTAWEEAGCLIEFFESSHPLPPVPTLVEAGSRREEIALCAHWVRRRLELAATEQQGGPQTRPRIAVIAADAIHMRSEVERIFRQVLAPAAVPVSAPQRPLPFEFSLGVPLAQIPMARAALMLLRWMEEGLSQQEASWLTLSGFFWSKEPDLLPLAEADAELRRSRAPGPDQDLSKYLRRGGWRKNEASLELRDRLYAAQRAWREGRGSLLSLAEWAERSEAILSAAGWPGSYRMLEGDFQARAKWEQLLAGVSTLAFDGTPVSYREFLRVLEHEAQRTIFSPESYGAPVQVLGPFEAAGMEFDAVWFLGADDRSWPAPGRPHPFLTQALQKQRGMPHADSDADWKLAKLVTERIQKSTPLSIFSYAAQDKEGQRRPAAVFQAPPAVVSALWMREQLALGNNDLEEDTEPPALEVPVLEVEEEPASGIVWSGESAAGGYKVLSLQAACPFQAFAQVRLSARDLDQRDWGLDAAERGKVLHKILEELWGELRDRSGLLEASSEGRLRTIIQRHVSRALSAYGGALALPEPRTEAAPAEQYERWTRAYLQAEYERIVRLVEDWLAYEKLRPPFTVEEREQVLTAQIGELKLKLRADRIDGVETSQGRGRLLIDYKTGEAKAAGWKGERPDDPQLPLYAVYGNVANLRGALLARVRADDLKFDGSVADPALLPGGPGTTRRNVPPYSPELERQWAEKLLALAMRFVEGDAEIDPKNGAKTCESCALPGLCRIAEDERKSLEHETRDHEPSNFSPNMAGSDE